MLIEMIENRIQLQKKAGGWEEAITLAMQPLLHEGFITRQYIDKTIESVIKNGPYIILLPGFAMPHTRPENGAVKTGMAFLNLKEPVTFPDGSQVSVLLALAAKDSDAHLDTMSELTDILMDDDLMERMFCAKKTEDIAEIFK